MPRRAIPFVIASVLVGAVVSPAAAQQVRVSVATDGTQSNSNSVLPSMSASGRFVAFMSFASNLVAGDTNGVEDVFLRDRDTDADGVLDEPGAVSTVRVSQRGAVQANGPSHQTAITPDGRYVVFTSFASNLFSVGQPPLAVSVVLRWDRLTGDIVLVSQTTAGEPLLAVRAFDPDVSDDGNHVVFVYGGGERTEPSGYPGIIYRRDIAAGTLTELQTIRLPNGVEFKGYIVSPSISGDGATIAYGSELRSHIHGRSFGRVYAVDAATNAVRLESVGVQPRLSGNGAFLTFIEAQGENGQGPLVRVHLASGERRSVGNASINARLASLSPSGRYLMVDGLLVDFDYGSSLVSTAGIESAVAFDASDAAIAFSRDEFVPTRQVLDVVVANLATLLDPDGDGLNGHWEAAMGLAPDIAAGPLGAAGDPDSDGLTNAQEFARGSHPNGTASRFLAEGASGAFFSTRYAIANPNAGPATVALRLELDGGGVVRRTAWIAPGRTITFDSRAHDLGTASFSAVVESDVPVVVDRLMTWGDAQGVPYGSHAEASGAAPETSWFLAEGSTVLGFQLFYLLQNPQATPVTATVRFLLPSGTPVVRIYDLPAQSRTTVNVNAVPGLASTDVSAEITSTLPIAVERAMYRSAAGQPFALGHAAAAVTQPSANWFFGEGSTGAFFDTYLLFANASAQPATVQVDYLRDQGGAVTRTYAVPANSRFSVYVDGEPGMEGATFGTRVTSSVPIAAERAMYWAGGFFDYYEGHVSAGATQTGRRWLLAAGEQGGAYGAETFVLIANTGPSAVTVRLATLPESGAAVLREFPIPAQSRLTVPVSMLAPEVRGGIEVLEATPQSGLLVVEGAIYWSVAGQPFAAGASWPATRLQ
jgi:Tol biopolymer transport system component